MAGRSPVASQRMPAKVPSREGRPARSQPESTRLLTSRITLHRPQVEDCGFPVGVEVFILTLTGLGGEAWPWQGGPPKGEVTSWGTHPRRS